MVLVAIQQDKEKLLLYPRRMTQEDGYLYVLSNPGITEKKVGRTTNISARIRSYCSGHPDRYTCTALVTCPINLMNRVERFAHKAIHKYQVNRGGGIEFFNIDDRQVDDLLELVIQTFPQCKRVLNFDPMTGKSLQNSDDPHLDTLEDENFNWGVLEPILMQTEYFVEYEHDDGDGGYELPWPIVKFFIEKFNLRPPNEKLRLNREIGENVYGSMWACFTLPVANVEKRLELAEKVLRNCENMSERMYQCAKSTMNTWVNLKTIITFK